LPAIHIARLRKQAVELAEYFLEPQRFDFHFTQLLDFYSNRTIKPGKKISSRSQIKAFNVQDPIIRIILTEISPLALKNPRATLSLSKQLWSEYILEKRILSIRLLGLLPDKDSALALLLIEERAQNCHEDQLLVEFAYHPLLKIQSSDWFPYLEKIQKWLNSENDILIRLALISLSTILKEQNITDLPPVFKLVKPLISEPSFKLRSLLNPILRSLIRQSPDEVMFLIRQIYSSEETISKNFIWLLKQNVAIFPERHQDSVDSMINKN
jgi:hypothetical protein